MGNTNPAPLIAAAGRRCLSGMRCPASCATPCDRALQLADEANQIPGWHHRMCGEEVFRNRDDGLLRLDGGYTRSRDRRFWLLWNFVGCEGAVGSRHFRLPHWFNQRAVTDDFGQLVRVDWS